MNLLKKLGRTRAVQNALGFIGAFYLDFVRATSRLVAEPADPAAAIKPDLPIIVAMWHGQHFMIYYAWGKKMPVAALISRHGDGEINAQLLRRIGVMPIRGSGGPPQKMRQRGGAVALRAMLRALGNGFSVAITADVPKTARVAGAGIITLAQMSGRPIYPIAVVMSRRIDLKSWDRASIGLPFSRGAVVLGDVVRVPRDADDATIERLRGTLETRLDDVHRRAYARLGVSDPGARSRTDAAVTTAQHDHQSARP